MLAWVGKSSNPFIMKYFSPPLIGLPHPILSNLLETPPSWTLRLPSLSRAVSLSTPPCEYISLLIVILFDTSQFDFLFQKEIETSVYRIIMWQMKKREVTWVTVCVCSGDPILDEGGDFDLDETMDMARQVEEFLSQPSEAQWSRQQSWPLNYTELTPGFCPPPPNQFFFFKQMFDSLPATLRCSSWSCFFAWPQCMCMCSASHLPRIKTGERNYEQCFILNLKIHRKIYIENKELTSL